MVMTREVAKTPHDVQLQHAEPCCNCGLYGRTINNVGLCDLCHELYDRHIAAAKNCESHIAAIDVEISHMTAIYRDRAKPLDLRFRAMEIVRGFLQTRIGWELSASRARAEADSMLRPKVLPMGVLQAERMTGGER